MPSTPFRAHPSAAPLKHAHGLPGDSEEPAFRAHPSAAPLKLVGLLHPRDRHFRLPRSPERGSIEASREAMASVTMPAFRAHPSAAPLKHVDAVGLAAGRVPSALTRARLH